MSDPLNKLLSLFPHQSIRPTQAAALRVIAQMFREDRGFTIIEAPTGAGKSALAFTTALYAASCDDQQFRSGAYILTPSNNLAEQMIGAFGDIGIAALKGRRHYTHQKSSSYENAKSAFYTNSIGVTNYAYFLKASHLPERQVLVLDEAHNLERILLDHAGFAITPQICRAARIGTPPPLDKTQTQIVDWLGLVLLPALEEEMNRCNKIDEQRRECMDLAERVANYLQTDDRDHWLLWAEERVLNAKPLSVATQAHDLFARARHVLIQSATVFDFASFESMLGIPDTALRFSAESDFPVGNRPIFYKPIGDMASRAAEKTVPDLCREVERIVKGFGASKGIVHTHSYWINNQVSEHLKGQLGDRVITHGHDPRQREKAIRCHCTFPGASVLVSPSLTEGIDLAGDLARFQVICKVPFPRLDAYARARVKRDRRWYDLKTAWALVQTAGRAIRSDTDFATTFILDSRFGDFASRNSSILPAWWKTSIRSSTEGL